MKNYIFIPIIFTFIFGNIVYFLYYLYTDCTKSNTVVLHKNISNLYANIDVSYNDFSLEFVLPETPYNLNMGIVNLHTTFKNHTYCTSLDNSLMMNFYPSVFYQIKAFALFVPIFMNIIDFTQIHTFNFKSPIENVTEVLLSLDIHRLDVHSITIRSYRDYESMLYIIAKYLCISCVTCISSIIIIVKRE